MVLEALQKQLPVVTTKIGAEGMPFPLNYLKVADKPHEFAEKVLKLYRDEEIWTKQVENGVICLNEYFSKMKAKEILGMDIELNEKLILS